MRTCHHYPKRKYHMELITLLYQIWGAHPDKTEFPCVRQKYPKCTIFAASDQHPKGFVSVENAFSWPTVFLRRLADKFGQSWVCERINSWSWSMSTAFSGIGAAESVWSSAACYQLWISVSPANPVLRQRLLYSLQQRNSSGRTGMQSPVWNVHLWLMTLRWKLTKVPRRFWEILTIVAALETSWPLTSRSQKNFVSPMENPALFGRNISKRKNEPQLNFVQFPFACCRFSNSTIALLSPFQPSPCPQDCPSMQLARASALDGLNQCAMIRWINPFSMTWHT